MLEVVVAPVGQIVVAFGVVKLVGQGELMVAEEEP